MAWNGEQIYLFTRKLSKNVMTKMSDYFKKGNRKQKPDIKLLVNNSTCFIFNHLCNVDKFNPELTDSHHVTGGGRLQNPNSRR
jgi:hypothetical protein